MVRFVVIVLGEDVMSYWMHGTVLFLVALSKRTGQERPGRGHRYGRLEFLN